LIYLFNQTEQLIDVIDESVLVEFTHTIELNQFERANFELPVDYKPKIMKEAQFFGFLSKDGSFRVQKISEKRYEDVLSIEGIDRAESDLSAFIIEDKRPNGSADQALESVLENTGYRLGERRGLVSRQKNSFYYITAREALVKIIEKYGCEFRTRYTFVENKINGRYIDLYQRMGSATGHQFEYGSNILDVTYEESSDDVITALIGRGKGEEKTDEKGQSTGTFGRRIQFTNVVWSKAKGDPVDKPAGQNYVSNEASKRAYGLHQDGVIKHRFGVYVNESIETPEELLKAAYSELEKLSVPITTFKASLLDLTNEIGRDIWVGDSVAVVRDAIGIAFEVRVHKIKIDKLNDNRSSVELGDYQTLKSKDRASKQQAIEDVIGGPTDSRIEAILAEIEAETQKKEQEIKEQIRINRLEIDNAKVLATQKAEELKQEITTSINNKVASFEELTANIDKKAAEALKKSGVNEVLANEAKQIGLDSIAKLEEFKRRATNAQTVLSGDLDGLKQTVTSEVNQASEHRRTTTEALSRMTGQMNGFATKSEVKQDIDGLTQAFAKMKVGSRNYAEDYDFSRGLWLYSQGDNSPQDWTISNGEYNVKGTTNTWKQMQIHSKEGSRSSWKSSTALLDLELGETYTLSFQGICYSGNPSVWVTLRANRTAPGNHEIIYGTFNLTSSWQTYQVTIPALTKPDNFDFWRIILGYDKIGHVAFRKIELTRSSTRIDAGPAPEDGKTDLVVAKSEFEKTAEGLSAKMTAVESYVGQDGQRQEALRRYTREESARQATAVREQISKDYVGKNTFQESVQGVERRLESLSLGTSGNLLKNSNDGFRNQQDKRYRLVETLQANQTYTLVSKYWNGENATGHTFLDGIGNWRHLTYNSAIDAWMVQFTPTQKIPAGTEITLSSDPGRSVGNMSWATLVRGVIPLIHWQPAKGDIEEGVTHKLAEYKETVDGRFATISSQINGKANQADFQRVKETSQLYERILGNSENGITNNVARMALTNQLFQVEVAKNLGSDNNLIVRSKSMDRHTLVNEGNTKRVFVNDGIFTIQCAGNSGYTFAGFTLPLYIDRMARGETYTLNFKYRIMGRLDHNFIVVAKNHQANEGIFSADVATSSTAVSSDWKEFNSTYTISKDFEFGEHKLYPLYFYLAKNGWVEIKEIMLVRAAQTNGYKASQFDDMSEAVRSVQSQLAGSWAVKNLNNAGNVVSEINAHSGGVRLAGKTIQLDGEVLMNDAFAKNVVTESLKTGDARIGKLLADTVTTSIFNANNADIQRAFISKLIAERTFTDGLVANNAFTNTLTANQGFISALKSRIITAESITSDMLNVNQAMIRKLVSNYIFTNELTAQRGFIHQLQSKIINTEVLDAFRGRIGGFNLGPFPQGGGRWIAGNNPYICGMGNGEGGGVRTAFWANWGNNWNKAGWGSWVVNTDGKMYCKNEANFYHKVDFANTCAVNFYSRPNASKGIWTGDGEINGNGSNPAGGQNAVVWWNQLTTGKWRQHAGITTASDRRLKENIEPTPVKALDKIKDLNLVAFDYIKDKSYEEIGLIAQEVLDVVPNAVNEYEGKDSHLTINYAKFIPYLLKAIQELNKKINLMEERYGSII
jgi:phage minor structural protein